MTHRFRDESSSAPPPTLSRLGAVLLLLLLLLQLITMVFTVSQAKKHTTLHQTVVPQFHMPEPVRITAEAPRREQEDAPLFLSIAASELLTSFTL